VVYCRAELLIKDRATVNQLLSGLSHMPVPIDNTTLVISDNGDIYGTVSDLELWLATPHDETGAQTP
jgi:hypothetical protein